MNKWILVGETKKTGKGIFTKKSFLRGETVFVIRGTKKSYNGRIPSKIGQRWIGIGVNKWINPSRQNPAWFINHSCDPNVGRNSLYKIVAMRDIDIGEELTIDYSMTEEDPLWAMKCSCGAKNCRKIIQSIHHLPIGIFLKYRNFIPKFLIKIFESKHKQMGQ